MELSESTMEVVKHLNTEMNKIVSGKPIGEIFSGDVLGWTGNDGTGDDKKTVHMEIFMKDEKNFKAFKSYTEKQLEEYPRLKTANLLNLENMIEETGIKQSFSKKDFIIDAAEVVKLVDSDEGGKLKTKSIDQAVKKDSYRLRYRNTVAKIGSEWKGTSDKDGDFGQHITDRLTDESCGYGWKDDKVNAFKELQFDKLGFFNELKGKYEVEDSWGVKESVNLDFPNQLFFFHPITFIHHMNKINKQPELIFVYASDGWEDDQFIFLSDEEELELKKEEDFCRKLALDLDNANKDAMELNSSDTCPSPQEVEKARKKIQKAKGKIEEALTVPHSTMGGVDTFTEVWRLRDRKKTVIRGSRAKRIKSRRHKFVLVKDKSRSLKKFQGVTNWRTDFEQRQKLKNQFAQQVGKANITLMKKGGNFLELFSENLAKNLDEINDYCQKHFNKEGNEEEIHFDASAEARFLRYYANAAVDGVFDVRKKRFGIDANGDASISVVEARVKGNAYFPNKAGFELKFQFKSFQFNLGRVRASIELNGSGMIGASIVGSVSINFSLDKEKDKWRVRGGGTKIPQKKAKWDGVKASGRLFAGAEAGGQAIGAFEWDNPEKRKDNKPGTGWCCFASLGYGIKGAAGIGAGVDFEFKWERGRIKVYGKAEVVLGLGAGGMVLGVIDAKSIWEFVQLIYHQLWNNRFGFLDYIDTEIFKRISRLTVWAIEKGESLLDYWQDQIEKATEPITNVFKDMEEWWDERKLAIDDADRLAERIEEKPDILKFTTPEAKGMMLYTLWQGHKAATFTFGEKYEEAIVTILDHIQNFEEYDKVCARLSAEGTKVNPMIAYEMFIDILDGNEDVIHTELINRWILRLDGELVTWADKHKEILGDHQADSPVTITNWRTEWKNRTIQS